MTRNEYWTFSVCEIVAINYSGSFSSVLSTFFEGSRRRDLAE
jgi:hypothetical protein